MRNDDDKVMLLTNLYEIVQRAVSEGVQIGWRRAHKHVDNPDEPHIIMSVEREVMSCLDEVIRWE